MGEGSVEVARPTRARGLLIWAMVAWCAFLSGAAVMVYEFLAVRILQRDFGGSVDVWASEIAVCLAGLAVGYGVGGWAADRFRRVEVVGLALVVGGASGIAIEPLALYAGDALLEVETGLAWHPLIAALVSTVLPILALGTVLPQAVALSARDNAHVGASTGRMAALSTVGSIAGTLVTVMVLLPRWGVIEILNATSVLLVVSGVAAIAAGRLIR